VADACLLAQAADAAAAREAAEVRTHSQAGDAKGAVPNTLDRGTIPDVEGLVDLCVQEGTLQRWGRGRAGTSRTDSRKAKLTPRRNEFKKGRAE
jgi:hypothetical protein